LEVVYAERLVEQQDNENSSGQAAFSDLLNGRAIKTPIVAWTTPEHRRSLNRARVRAAARHGDPDNDGDPDSDLIHHTDGRPEHAPAGIFSV
jgi:hypothetical protein